MWGRTPAWGLTHGHRVQRSAWGNCLRQPQPRYHKAPSPDSILTPTHTFCSSTNPKSWGAERRFVTSPPLSSKHLIKELDAAVNSEAKKESKHELSWAAGEHS